MGHIKLLHFLIERMGKDEFARQLVYHEMISINHYLSIVYFTNHHYNYVYEVLDTLIDCNYLSNRQKKRVTDIKEKIEKKQGKK